MYVGIWRDRQSDERCAELEVRGIDGGIEPIEPVKPVVSKKQGGCTKPAVTDGEMVCCWPGGGEGE